MPPGSEYIIFNSDCFRISLFASLQSTSPMIALLLISTHAAKCGLIGITLPFGCL